METNFVSKKVIVRGENSGVFFGTLKERDGAEVVLTNCRCLWYWDGACSLLQLALEGTNKPDECNFTVTIPEIVIIDAIEIIPCEEEAIESIESVEVWRSK